MPAVGRLWPSDDDDGDDDDDDGMVREDELRGRVDVPGGEEDGEAEDRARGDQGLAANLVKVAIFFFSSYLKDKFPVTVHDTITIKIDERMKGCVKKENDHFLLKKSQMVLL